MAEVKQQMEVVWEYRQNQLPSIYINHISIWNNNLKHIW